MKYVYPILILLLTSDLSTDTLRNNKIFNGLINECF